MTLYLLVQAQMMTLVAGEMETMVATMEAAAMETEVATMEAAAMGDECRMHKYIVKQLIIKFLHNLTPRIRITNFSAHVVV